MNLPPIDHLQLEATSILTETDGNGLYKKWCNFLRHYEAINYSLSYDFPLWRARKCIDSTGFANTGELYYPPPSITKAGRVNEAGAPVLYLSFSKFTTLYEIGARQGDYVHLAGYSMNKDRPLRTLIIGEINNVHKRGQGLLPGRLSEEINKILNGLSFETGYSFVFMDAFLAGVLSDRNAGTNNYLHSRTLCKALLEKYEGIDAIHYPSVALEGSMNLAIIPKAADKALRVMGTSVMVIEKEYDYGLFRFRLIRYSKSPLANGVIVWTDVGGPV